MLFFYFSYKILKSYKKKNFLSLYKVRVANFEFFLAGKLVSHLRCFGIRRMTSAKGAFYYHFLMQAMLDSCEARNA